MVVGLPYVVNDKGDYRFTLKLITAKPQSPDFVEQYWHREPQPLTFERTLPGLAPQYLSEQHGTQAVFGKTWKIAVSTRSEPARSTGSESAEHAQSAPNSAVPPARTSP